MSEEWGNLQRGPAGDAWDTPPIIHTRMFFMDGIKWKDDAVSFEDGSMILDESHPPLFIPILGPRYPFGITGLYRATFSPADKPQTFTGILVQYMVVTSRPDDLWVVFDPDLLDALNIWTCRCDIHGGSLLAQYVSEEHIDLLLDLARSGEEAQFKDLARTLGVKADLLDEMWAGTLRRIRRRTP